MALVSVEDLTCSLCKKYLSVPPIYTSVDGEDICGRCIGFDEDMCIRNTTYEKLAKILQFPCSLSKNCKEQLKWGDVLAHEEVCQFRSIVCPDLECKDVVEMRMIGQHFSQKHRDKLFKSGSFEIPLPATTKLYLSEFDNNCFVVAIFIDKDAMGINVSRLIGKLDYRFTVTLEFNKDTHEFQELHIPPFPGKEVSQNNPMSKLQFSWKKKSLTDIFRSDDFKDMKICFHIFDDKKPIERGLMEDLLRSSLECPVCFNVMKCDNIINCPTGHSICSNCYKTLMRTPNNNGCPTCRSRFASIVNRNYPLETLRQKILEIRPDILDRMDEQGTGSQFSVRELMAGDGTIRRDSQIFAILPPPFLRRGRCAASSVPSCQRRCFGGPPL